MHLKVFGQNNTGSTLMELIVVIVLFVVLVPASLNIFLSARKVGGQSYVQAQAAIALGEVEDILRYLRNQGFSLIEEGEFYLIRNPGTGSWLVKNDLPSLDTYERKVTVVNARRHESTDDLFLEGDTGPSYEDPYTKEVTINILWSPDYIPLDQAVHTVYITDWQNSFPYPSS